MQLLLADSELEGVAYWEVIGPRAEDADQRFDEAVAAVRRFRALERPGGVRVGVSPHTPHTVSGALLDRLARWARAERLPLAIHVGETPAEVQLHRSGEGPLAAALAGLGAAFTPSGLSPLGYLSQL